MHLPLDQRGMKITQKLKIEKGVVEIDLKWASGAGAKVSCFIAPKPNALVVKWNMTNWTEETATPETAPVHDCTFHRRVVVARRNGHPAQTGTGSVELRTLLALPERYAAWAQRERLPLLPRIEAKTASTATPRVVILSPQDGSNVLGDPESPEAFSSLPLRGTIDPPVAQATWYVDGEPCRGGSARFYRAIRRRRTRCASRFFGIGAPTGIGIRIR